MAQQSWNNIWKDLPVKGIVYENLYPGLLRHNNPVDATNGEGGGGRSPRTLCHNDVDSAYSNHP